MKSEPASVKHTLRLALVAVFCALPFLAAAGYLVRDYHRVETLPYDAYRDLRWVEDGKGLLFLHRPLTQSGEQAQTELWLQNTRSSKFSELGRLPLDYSWKLTPRYTESSLLLEAESAEEKKLALFSREEKGKLEFLKVSGPWVMLPTQGRGLFFASEEKNIPFDQFADIEPATEVRDVPDSPHDEDTLEEEGIITPPTRAGLKIARYREKDRALEPVLSIPFTRPEEKPEVQLVQESPDGRFLAMVLSFGSGTPGLWVYDSQNSRLLWTRVVAVGAVTGIDWSDDSVGLVLTDGGGVVILESAIKVESIRYKASGLEGLRPHWTESGGLLLANPDSVYKFDREASRAIPLFESKKRGAIDMSVGPTGMTVAYFASPRGYYEVFLTDLDGRDEVATRTTLPGSLRELAQGTLEYQLGRSISHAWQVWGERLR